MLGKCLFSRDPERPFDTERPRNWGSFGAELNGLKPWRRGGFRCCLGGWLVVENASKLFFSIGIQSVRLTPNVRGIGAGLVWSRTQWVKAVAKGWFQMLFGRLVSGGKC